MLVSLFTWPRIEKTSNVSGDDMIFATFDKPLTYRGDNLLVASARDFSGDPFHTEEQEKVPWPASVIMRNGDVAIKIMLNSIHLESLIDNTVLGLSIPTIQAAL